MEYGYVKFKQMETAIEQSHLADRLFTSILPFQLYIAAVVERSQSWI